MSCTFFAFKHHTYILLSLGMTLLTLHEDTTYSSPCNRCTFSPIRAHTETDEYTATNTCKHLSVLSSPVSVSRVCSCISTGASDCCHGVKHPCNPSGFNQPPFACVYDAKHPATHPAAFHRCYQQIEDTWGGGIEKQTQSDLLLPDGLYSEQSSWTPHLLNYYRLCITNCLATTPGIIFVTHRRTLAKWRKKERNTCKKICVCRSSQYFRECK